MTNYQRVSSMEDILRALLTSKAQEKEHRPMKQSTTPFNTEVYQFTLTALLEDGVIPKKAVKCALKAGRKAAEGAETII